MPLATSYLLQGQHLREQQDNPWEWPSGKLREAPSCPAAAQLSLFLNMELFQEFPIEKSLGIRGIKDLWGEGPMNMSRWNMKMSSWPSRGDPEGNDGNDVQ